MFDLFRSQIRLQLRLYMVAPRDVMLAARRNMLRELTHRLKNELNYSRTSPANHAR